MDVAGLVAYEQDFPLEIRHPKTGEKIGIRFMVRHIDCEASTQAAQAKRVAKVMGVDADDNTVNQYASCVSGWDWGENTFGDMGVPEFSQENAQKVLTHPSAKWMLRQVMDAVLNIGNFTTN